LIRSPPLIAERLPELTLDEQNWTVPALATTEPPPV
jgi:hypothetical protein